ncbi:kinase-like protein [Saccharata proteae CBS 121410]|uniref:Kinase-like protein n=1 Tax=Saccharata proteae CBS 121410 TaxID=1314787 RepID=A0A9P4HUS1_9PEZI|nr:kinase-like protein [Saccharata proteae CBS 121410]
MTTSKHDCFNYTSGRWLYNEALRLKERQLAFNVQKLMKVVAESVQRPESDIKTLEKIAEGGFNRVFEITMHDGFQMLARLPYPSTVPKRLAVASEVATMDLVRSHGIPVPKIYSYSHSSDNPVGAEYIIMEKVRGKPAGEIWYDLSENERLKLLSQVVDIEARLFAIDLPASGSIYYLRDLPDKASGIPIPGKDHSEQFCLGPDASNWFWDEERSLLDIDRGPLKDPGDVMSAGAKKELEWVHKYGKPRFPLDRIYRESTGYQKSRPEEHLKHLEDYLRIASHVVPKDRWLHKPTIRHPDLQPNNLLVTDKLEIAGLIDWQHCNVLPFFLKVGFPNSLQNFGDEESERLAPPTLPDNLAELDEKSKIWELEQYRRRHIHFSYAAITKQKNPIHAEVLFQSQAVSRRRLFEHASEPWEGNNIPLKADLVRAMRDWPKLVEVKPGEPTPQCPIVMSDDEAEQCLEIESEQQEADALFKKIRGAAGVNSDGWTLNEYYDDAVSMMARMKEKSIEYSEDDHEREMTKAHWPFDDYDEKE